ncbi:MAG: hypothetical protein HQ518_30010 [Rhodopirellula sp.]|nr:hypothetical protein [Rhodopirellula sp.]
MKVRVQTLLTCVTALAIAGSLAWLIVVSSYDARRNDARNRLKQIMHELRIYDGIANHLPRFAELQEDGSAKSWRYDLWRFLDHRAGYNFVDESTSDFNTQFVAIVGPDTAFQQNSRISLKTLPDNMIIVVEVHDSQHHWEEPGADLNIDHMPQYIDTRNGKGISGDSKGVLVAFVTGEVWMLSNDVPFSTLSAFFTVSSAKGRSRDALLPYRLLPEAR